MTTFIDKKDFKMIDGRITTFEIYDDKIISRCGIFFGTYKHSQVNQMLEWHSKILTEKTRKEVQKFINDSREPEQLSLF